MTFRRTFVLAACAPLLLVFLPSIKAQQPALKWNLQYFYDEDRTELEIVDLAFPSATRGIAVGTIYDVEGRKKPQHVALVTSDGGAKWTQVSLKEAPRSIFFLNESLGWLVTDESIWFTEESGRSWTRIDDQRKPNRKLEAAPEGGLILRVWFLDPQHGFAAGMQKLVLETKDGGHSWTPVEEASKPQANPAFTVYSRIAFADERRGLIIGGYFPRRAGDDVPAWMVPEQILRRRQVPTLTLQLATANGGAQWSSSTAPLLGAVTSLRLAGTNGLAVFGYADSFEWPSEVYRLDLRTGKSESVFKQKDRHVLDSAIFSDGLAFLAAVEPGGALRSAPIPMPVKMLASTDFKNWAEMDVDYRAVARSIVLAGPDPEHLWAATDTGMILHLSPAKR